MKKYFINVLKEDETPMGFLINGCFIDIEDGDNYEYLVKRIYNVTDGGYKSKKDIFEKLDIVSISDCGQGVYISEDCAMYLKNKYSEKEYKVFQTPEQKAKSSNASAWNYICSNNMSDPYCTR